MEAITWARVSAVMASANNAIRLLSHWLHYLKERQCIREALKFAILLADICYSQDDPIPGHRYLSYALNETIPRGFCRIFPDEGPRLLVYIKQIGSEYPEPGQQAIKKIIAAYKRATSAASPRQVQSSVEASEVKLSDREIEILRMAQNDKSNAEISLSLSLTTGTVKWYWQNIFSKLGVRRRRQAAIIASDMGLIG